MYLAIATHIHQGTLLPLFAPEPIAIHKNHMHLNGKTM